MAFGKICAFLLLASLCLYLPTLTDAQCQTTFLTRFLTCPTNSTLNGQHFLWFVRDGAMGTQPPDLANFTQQACMKMNEMTPCIKSAGDQFQTLSICTDTDKETIRNFTNNVITNYDKKCAHPCRTQLIPSLSECFTGLNITLSMFNGSSIRNSLLGKNESDVDAICMKQDAVVKCMNSKIQVCPEAPTILLMAGIDVTTFNNTISFLCENPQLYLHGTKCLPKRSGDEQRCLSQLLVGQQMIDVAYQSKAMNLTVYATTRCQLRLDYIRCDLTSLGRRDVNSSCPDAVLGLRREQECTLLPTLCRLRPELKDYIMDLCDSRRFYLPDRLQTVFAGKQSSGAGVVRPGFLLQAGLVVILALTFALIR